MGHIPTIGLEDNRLDCVARYLIFSCDVIMTSRWRHQKYVFWNYWPLFRGQFTPGRSGDGSILTCCVRPIIVWAFQISPEISPYPSGTWRKCGPNLADFEEFAFLNDQNGVRVNFAPGLALGLWSWIIIPKGPICGVGYVKSCLLKRFGRGPRPN